MKPGDLLRPKRWHQAHNVPTTYLDVWDRPDGWDNWQGKWEHEQIGVLLEGRHVAGVEEEYAFVEVLLNGKVCWVIEDEVEVLDENR